MDLSKAVQDLYAEKEKVERAIALLEALQPTGDLTQWPNFGKRRGRKSMDSQERAEVSARMKKYWASRRQKTKVQAFAR